MNEVNPDGNGNGNVNVNVNPDGNVNVNPDGNVNENLNVNENESEIKKDLIIYDPIKTAKNIYYSRIMHESEEISFQLEKNILNLDKSKSKAIITVDDKSLVCINKISEAVIQFTSEKSKLWFGKHLNLEECKTIFKSNLADNKLTCFYDENSIFYDSKNTNIDISGLADELCGICLLKCDVVVYTKMYFFIRWEISQFKIKPEKSPMLNIYLTQYKIKDLPEHLQSYKDEEIVKKLDDITLF
jgi:hypothetical protein